MKKLVSLVLVLCLIVGFSTSASADQFVNSATYTISSSTQSATIAEMGLWNPYTEDRNFSSINCATHVKGRTTVYTYKQTETVTCNASESITANYVTAFSSLAGSLGVANSKGATINMGNTYTVSSTLASGNYRFRAEFTCYEVREEVIKYTSSGNSVIWNNTIESAPKSSGVKIVAYKT